MTLIFVLFILLLLIGMPIGFALCIPSVIYIIQNNIPLTIIAQRLSQSLNSFPLLAIPLFIMAGRFMNEGGVTKRIFRFANNAVGFIPGGLGHVNILASMIFAGMSGAGTADIGGLGQIEIKAMNDANYPIKFTAGITATSAIVGPIIPPSVPVVLFAVASDASALAIFAGGIIPGILIGLMLMITVFIYGRYRHLPKSPFPGFKELTISFIDAFPSLLAPVLLIGGMLSGVFSPTEAAGVTVLYSFILSVFIYRDFSLNQIFPILKELVEETARLTFLVAAAMLFAWVLIVEQIPQNLVIALTNLNLSPFMMLLVINGFFLILGLFLEATIVFLVVAPMFVPALHILGVSEVHFAILTILAMGIGMYTPPMGIALFMVQGLCKLSFVDTVKSVIPFLIPLLVALLFLTAFPNIVLFLPSILNLL
jgi:tripartite ATP-independent transporter DctM subunit